MKSSRQLDKLFQEADGDLAILITRTRLLKRLTHRLRSQLETELAAHCYVGNIEGGTLVILADTAARASKLRFYTPQLLEALPGIDIAFSGIRQIKVKVLNQPAAEAALPEEKMTGPHMNQDNARCINTLAENVDDPQLHDALLRLAKHAK